MKEKSQIENLISNFSKKFDKKLINLIPKKKLVQNIFTMQ